MKWEDNIKLVELSNQAYKSDEDLKNYQNFVLSVVNNFDIQAINIFLETTSLIPDEIEKHLEFYQKVSKKINYIIDNTENLNNFGLRSKFRLSFLTTILENKLKTN